MAILREFVKSVWKKREGKHINLLALQKISYGLYIVSSENNQKSNGQIVNAVMQITAQPPTIAVSINKDNYTHEIIKKSKLLFKKHLRKHGN